MIEKIENLNINDLDVQELENRLEMAMTEANMEAAGWLHPREPNCDPTRPGGPEPGCPPF